jgi:LPS O-antigen subunit length determinant protein (WzzB/FepE family)
MGGLAALAGVSIGGANTSEAEIALQIMKSWSFIEGFIADNDLAPEIFSAKGWNKESNELQINDGVYNTENKQWLIKNEAGVMGPPTSWDLFKTFSGQLAVTKEKKGMVSVSIEYYSPLIAKQWLDMYVAAINEHMRQRQVAKVTNNINYLQAQIEKTSVVEMREVFYAIIEEQTKNKMLAEASPEYAFVVVRQSMVPEEKSQPRRSSICILGTMLGGILSCLLVLMMHNFRKFD